MFGVECSIARVDLAHGCFVKPHSQCLPAAASESIPLTPHNKSCLSMFLLVSTGGFETSLILNTAFGCLFLIFFLIARPVAFWVFDARRLPQQRRIGREPPTQEKKGFLSWMRPLWETDQQTLLHTAGLDAVLFIDFFAFCAKLFFLLMVLSIGLLLPLNATSTSGQSDVFGWTSIANIPESSGRLWAHLVALYVVVGIFFYMVWHQWQRYTLLRYEYLAVWARLGGMHTVLVRDAPRELRSDQALYAYFDQLFPDQVRSARIMRDLRLSRTERTRLGAVGLTHIHKLETAVEKRAVVHLNLEREIALWQLQLSTVAAAAGHGGTYERRTLRTVLGCLVPVDAIDHYYAQLCALNDLIDVKKQRLTETQVQEESEQQVREQNDSLPPKAAPKEVPSSDHQEQMQQEAPVTPVALEQEVEQVVAKYTGTSALFTEKRVSAARPEIGRRKTRGLASGFVSFDTTAAALLASLAVYKIPGHASESMRVSLAPELRSMEWSSLPMRARARVTGTVVSWSLSCALIITWTIPVGFITALSNLKELSTQWSAFQGASNMPTVIQNFIEAFAPPILLGLSFLIVPAIFSFLSRWEGHSDWHSLQLSVQNKYFAWVVVNSFFISIIGGSFFGDLTTVLGNVTGIPTVLGQTMPKVSEYFTTYLLWSSLGYYPFQLSCILGVIIGGLRKRYFAITPRDFKNVESPGEVWYGYEYPWHLFVFIVGISYSVVSPLLLVFVFAYFALGWWVNKYQLMWTWVQRSESGGIYWPSVYPKMLASVFIAEFCVAGLFGLKQATAQAILVVPLVVVTIGMAWIIHTTLHLPSKELDVKTIMEIDRMRKKSKQTAQARMDKKLGEHSVPFSAAPVEVPSKVAPISQSPPHSSLLDPIPDKVSDALVSPAPAQLKATGDKSILATASNVAPDPQSQTPRNTFCKSVKDDEDPSRAVARDGVQVRPVGVPSLSEAVNNISHPSPPLSVSTVTHPDACLSSVSVLTSPPPRSIPASAIINASTSAYDGQRPNAVSTAAGFSRIVSPVQEFQVQRVPIALFSSRRDGLFEDPPMSADGVTSRSVSLLGPKVQTCFTEEERRDGASSSPLSATERTHLNSPNAGDIAVSAACAAGAAVDAVSSGNNAFERTCDALQNRRLVLSVVPTIHPVHEAARQNVDETNTASVLSDDHGFADHVQSGDSDMQLTPCGVHLVSREASALLGFPYASTTQDRAYAEGDVLEYAQMELQEVVPHRLELRGCQQWLSDQYEEMYGSKLAQMPISSPRSGNKTIVDAPSADKTKV
jgi:hypothetical protein